jgi:tRNA modification GTPase
MQAEAVLGVIDARDRAELQQALEQLGGGISSQVVRLRGDLLDLLADLEAGLDFADEEIEFVSHATLIGRIGLARAAVVDLTQHAAGRLRSATRPRVVLAGLPNAGKSTLFNALVGSDAAIVSDQRGTTRDYLAAHVSAQGVTFTLVDTAGSESADGAISDAAQQLRREQLARADLVVCCVGPESSGECLTELAGVNLPAERLLIVRTKVDLNPVSLAPFSPLAISAKTGAGLHELASAIAERLVDPAVDSQGLLGTTAARCRDSLHGARSALDRALAIARGDSDEELLAIELREALDEIGKIVGAVYTDDILDRIFSKFCIGK